MTETNMELAKTQFLNKKIKINAIAAGSYYLRTLEKIT